MRSFLPPSTNLPHAEERPKAASRSTRHTGCPKTLSSSLAQRLGGRPRHGDRAEDVVEPAAFGPEGGDRPAAGPNKLADLGQDRMIATREQPPPLAVGIACR